MATTNENKGAAYVRPLYKVPHVDLTLRYRHEAASADLIVPVHLVCNTPDEVLHANIRANSLPTRKWAGTEAINGAPAILCGSGPSLADCLGTIDELHARGGVIFAMNGAASYLASKGIYADYQVIADARPQTADLIGPAKHHIFASQVDPSLFAKKPEASLFHVNPYDSVDDFLDLLPDYDGEFVMIGSHGSVGNVAMSLAYAMGHRDLQVFGYDSSHRGDASHAFEQEMNKLEPVTRQRVESREYLTTFTMKSQADVFPRLAYNLQVLGCKITVHGDGYLPDRWNAELAKTPEQREADKYAAMWGRDEYRSMSPALSYVAGIVDELSIETGERLIDFGCGSGRATKELIDRGVHAVGFDIAPNALETDAPFIQGCLWDLPESLRALNAEWGMCCDVMEHIPTDKVNAVLDGIAGSVSKGAFFAIDNHDDTMGVLIGAPLHLTVRPYDWWAAKLKQRFAAVTHLGDGAFLCFHNKGRS